MVETDLLTRRGALALMAGGLAAPAAFAQQPTYRLGHGFDPDSLAGAAAEHFAGLLAERTGTALEIFPRNQIIANRDAVDALYRGSLDFHVGAANVKAELMELQVFDVPFLIRDPGHLARVMEIGLEGPISDIFEERDLFLIAPIATGAHVVTSAARPVLSPEDLQGMKLSVRAGSMTEEGFTRLGANSLRVTSAELYPATQVGALDGIAASLEAIEALRLYETQRYLSLTRHVYGVAFLLMSMRRAEELGLGREGLREIGQEVSRAALDRAMESDATLTRVLRDRGLEIIEIEPGRFEYTKKVTYDIYLSRVPEAWRMLNLVEDTAYG